MFYFTFASGWRGKQLPPPDGQWHHYGVTARDGDLDPQLYIDGVLQAIDRSSAPLPTSASNPMDLRANSADLHIGAQVEPVFSYYAGSAFEVDDLAIYDGILSACDIAMLAAAGPGGKCLTLSADSCSVAAATGGTVNFVFDAGPTFSGATFAILGSASGTAPGIAVPGGMTLPLVPDFYFNYLAVRVLSSPYHSNFLGSLDSQGSAQASLTLPPLGASMASVHHAAVATDGTSLLLSNPVPLSIIP